MIKQGCHDGTMYLLLEGTLSIRVNGVQVAIRTAGYDNILYGELSMLRNEPFSASIVARDSVRCGVLTADAFLRVYFNEMFPPRQHELSKVHR